MLRALFRFLGYVCLAIGFVAFVVDGARSVANKEWTYLQIKDVLDTVMPHAYAGWQEAAKLHLPGFLWDPVLVKTLASPFFFASAIIALFFLLLGKKPRARIGYSNRD
jgi:hypothetical protein